MSKNIKNAKVTIASVLAAGFVGASSAPATADKKQLDELRFGSEK